MIKRSPVLLCLLPLLVLACASPQVPRTTSTSSPALGDSNPGRGYFQWNGMQVVPPHRLTKAASDVYKRFTWRELEPQPGQYQWGALTALFDDNPESRVAFRIRSMIDYGTPDPGDAIPKSVPDGIPGWEADTSGDGVADVFVPDWNAEAYLAGVERLWQALRVELAKTGADGRTRLSRISWIDVGMFGQYGEWYLRTAPSTSSPTSPWVDYSQAPAGIVPFASFSNTEGNPRKRLVDAQLKAFPEARWVMFFLYDQREVLNYLFHQQTVTSLPVGWRFDGLGAPQFLEKQWQINNGKPDPARLAWWEGADGRPAFRDRWKFAPVVAEYYGPSANAATALQQVRDFHIGMVGNGNFTSGKGTDATHWDRVDEQDQSAWRAIGAAAGWRLKALDSGSMTFGAGTFTWTGRVTNAGSSPAWEPWGARVTFGGSVSVEVALTQAFPAPGETVTVTFSGSLPASVSASSSWSWVPTIRGMAATWSGAAPSRGLF